MKKLLAGALILAATGGALAYNEVTASVGNSVASAAYNYIVSNLGAVSTSNPLPTMTGGTQTFSFSQSANGDIQLGSTAIIDAQLGGDIAEADVYFSSVGTGGAVGFSGSNDQSTWFALDAQRNDGLWTLAVPAAVTYPSNQWSVPLKFRYFKMTVSSMTAGSVVGSVTFKTKSAPVPPGVSASAPSVAQLYALGSGYTATPVTQASQSTQINVNTAGTFNLVAASGSTQVFLTDLEVIASGATLVWLEYGTQTTTPCDTGTTDLTGPFSLVAQTRISHGVGLGAFLTAPPGKQLCIVNTNAVQISGFASYAQR